MHSCRKIAISLIDPGRLRSPVFLPQSTGTNTAGPGQCNWRPRTNGFPSEYLRSHRTTVAKENAGRKSLDAWEYRSEYADSTPTFLISDAWREATRCRMPTQKRASYGLHNRASIQSGMLRAMRIGRSGQFDDSISCGFYAHQLSLNCHSGIKTQLVPVISTAQHHHSLPGGRFRYHKLRTHGPVYASFFSIGRPTP